MVTTCYQSAEEEDNLSLINQKLFALVGWVKNRVEYGMPTGGDGEGGGGVQKRNS